MRHEAKKLLAFEATRLCHGAEAATAAAETARKTFGEGAYGSALPVVDVQRVELEDGIAAFELFRRSELCATGGEARRLIKGGGARVNDAPIASETASVTLGDVNAEGVIKLSAGKKRHALVRAV